jgi:hypothetical protein
MQSKNEHQDLEMVSVSHWGMFPQEEKPVKQFVPGFPYPAIKYKQESRGCILDITA